MFPITCVIVVVFFVGISIEGVAGMIPKLYGFFLSYLRFDEISILVTPCITMFTLGLIFMYVMHFKNENVAKRKNRNFYQLIILNYNISTDVLREVMDSKILYKYGNSLFQFLDKEKHYLYHILIGNAPCCECSTSDRYIRSSKKTIKWLFKIIYEEDVNSKIHERHAQNCRLSNNCLQRFVPKSNLAVTNFDVTVLSFFLEHYANLSANEIDAYKSIVSVRNSISHAPRTSCYNLIELESMWTKLRGSCLTLTDSSCRDHLESQINTLGNEFDIGIKPQRMERIDNKLEELYQFVNESCLTKDCTKEFENRIFTCIQNELRILKYRQMSLANQSEKSERAPGVAKENLIAYQIGIIDVDEMLISMSHFQIIITSRIVYEKMVNFMTFNHGIITRDTAILYKYI